MTKQKQPPVMDAVPPQKKQAISNEVLSVLQMLAKADLDIRGEITAGTLDAIQTQGFALKDGTVQKSAPAKGKPSVRSQLHNSKAETLQHLPPEKKPRGDESR